MFVLETFIGPAGQNISLHTGETGASWSYGVPNNSPILLDGDGFVYGSGVFAVGVALASGIPADADYVLSSTFKFWTQVASINAYLVINYTAGKCILAGHDNNSGTWILKEFGTGAAVFDSVATTWSPGDTADVAVTRTGSTYTLVVDGVATLSIESTFVPAKGVVGVYFQGAATDTTGTHIGNLQADDTPLDFGTVFYADNSAFRYFGFFKSGAGAASFAHSNNGGNYLLVNFTGTSFTATFDLAILAGLSAELWPYVYWRVDDGDWNDDQLASGTDSVTSTGLAAGTHRLEMIFGIGGGTNQFTDGAPQQAVRFKTLTVATGETISRPVLKSARGLIYGDSLIVNQNQTFEPQYGIPALLRARLPAEIDVAAFSGQGWSQNAYLGGSNTTFADTALFYDSTHSRLNAAAELQRYDWIYIEHGKNGTPTAEEVQSQLVNLRAVYDGLIMVQIGAYDGTNADVIRDGFDAYKLDNPDDANMRDIDTGVIAFDKVADNTHASIQGAIDIVDVLAPAMLAIIPSKGGGFYRFGGMGLSL